MSYSLQNDRFERSINENRSVIPILIMWLSHVDSGPNLINGIIMSLYHYLAIYIAGFIAMFALLVRGDRVHGLEFDLADTLITSFLWPFYSVAIICIKIYERFKQNRH